MTAAQFKQIRTANNWTWKQFARRLGYSPSYVNNIAAGTRPITNELVERVHQLQQTTATKSTVVGDFGPLKEAIKAYKAAQQACKALTAEQRTIFNCFFETTI
jgi:transcriptional regulator with XRE-family HTH domain